MATDFFQRQSDARRRSGWLFVLFALAVVSIVGAVTAITAVALNYYQATQLPELAADAGLAGYPRWAAPATAATLTLLLIGGGSLFKVVQLRRGGGTIVAEQLGGRRLYPNTTDHVHRRLLNVVEEMALAAGTPVPPVFLLQKEKGINAFAAGYSPSDAVLGITQGCAEHLSRDELQGVVAHEFSHVLNGDMRNSIRLIGVLYGILLLGFVGQIVFRMFFYAQPGRGRNRDSKSGGGGGVILVLMAIALTLIVVGSIGTFFGNLIKAAVSRQREYLADASAVQFTRNPSGIANALRRIGSKKDGSKLISPSASEASHMYFSMGVWEGIGGLWATHPPLARRIKAIDPSWDGTFLAGPAASSASSATSELTAGFAEGQPGETAEVPAGAINDAVRDVGEPRIDHREYARQLLAALPDEILAAARDPYGARAVTFCLLLDEKPDPRQQQMRVLQQFASADLVSLTVKLLPEIDRLDVRVRLPLIDLTLPALRSISPRQYQEFIKCFEGLVAADHRIDLFEWVLSQVLRRHLRPQFAKVKSPPTHFYGLQRLGQPLSVLISAVARIGSRPGVAERAFAAANRQLPEVHLTLLPKEATGLQELQAALEPLQRVAARHRGRIVDACATAICADEHVHWREAELLRGISDLLDCPMPPLLVKAARDSRIPATQR